jgi:hypothetical protein
MPHRIDIETLTLCPKGTSDEDYEEAGANALKTKEILEHAQTVWAGRISSLRDLEDFRIALTTHFMENGAPMYFIMAADEQ